MASRHIVVLGGGISGLSTAWLLKSSLRHQASRISSNLPIHITLLEEKPKTGGWFNTAPRSEATQGFLLERGPHSFRPRGDNGYRILSLVQELGLDDQVIATSKDSAIRYIWTKEHQLEKLPTSIVDLFTSRISRALPWLAIPEMLMLRPKMPADDETVHAFFSRRFSVAVADTLASAMVSGIFAGDAKQLSLKSCFPVLWDLEYNYGSIIGGMMTSGIVGRYLNGKETEVAPLEFAGGSPLNDKFSSLVTRPGISFKNGMEVFTDTLSSQLVSEGNVKVTVQTGVKVSNVGQDGSVAYVSNDGTQHSIAADHVFSTLPSFALRDALGPSNPAAPALDEFCDQLPTVDVVVVNLGYRKSQLPRFPVKGFGHLVPMSSQGDAVLGVIYDSCVFPQQSPHGDDDCTWLTVMLGGARGGQKAMSMSDSELLACSRQHLEKTLGISEATAEPAVSMVNRGARCIPQYGVGHHNRVEDLREVLSAHHPKLTVLGNHFGGVGIADCVGNAVVRTKEYVETQLVDGGSMKSSAPSRGKPVNR